MRDINYGRLTVAIACGMLIYHFSVVAIAAVLKTLVLG